jgi:hypothetical protein
MSVAFEADLGVFKPQVICLAVATQTSSKSQLMHQGLEFTGSPAATSIMQEIMLLASALNATQVISGGSNVDSGPWGQAGVPYGAPMIANQVIIFQHQQLSLLRALRAFIGRSVMSCAGVFPVSSHGDPHQMQIARAPACCFLRHS